MIIANLSVDKFTAHKTTTITAKNQKQLNTIEECLFWNYVNWNCRYVQVILIWTFPCVFFTGKSPVQIVWLHDMSVIQKLKSFVEKCKNNLNNREVDYLTNFRYQISNMYCINIYLSIYLSVYINDHYTGMFQPEDLKKRPIIPIVCTPPLSAGGLNLLPNFQKGGIWEDFNFERGLPDKRGVTFFRGVAIL